jgi:hypothetical protein
MKLCISPSKEMSRHNSLVNAESCFEGHCCIFRPYNTWEFYTVFFRHKNAFLCSVKYSTLFLVCVLCSNANGLAELCRHLTTSICSNPWGMKITHYKWKDYTAVSQQVSLHLGLHVSLLGAALYTINNSFKLTLAITFTIIWRWQQCAFEVFCNMF